MTTSKNPKNISQNASRGGGRVRSRAGRPSDIQPQGPLRCNHPTCGYKPTSPEDLQVHLKREHGRKRKCREPHCDFHGTTAELDKHRSDEHYYGALSQLPANIPSPARSTFSPATTPGPSNVIDLTRSTASPQPRPLSAYSHTPSNVSPPSAVENAFHYAYLGGPSANLPPPVTSNTSAPSSLAAHQSVYDEAQNHFQSLAQQILHFTYPIRVPTPVKIWACRQFTGSDPTDSGLVHFWRHNRITLPEQFHAYEKDVLTRHPRPDRPPIFVPPPTMALTANFLDYLLPEPIFARLPEDVREFVLAARDYLAPASSQSVGVAASFAPFPPTPYEPPANMATTTPNAHAELEVQLQGTEPALDVEQMLREWFGESESGTSESTAASSGIDDFEDFPDFDLMSVVIPQAGDIPLIDPVLQPEPSELVSDLSSWADVFASFDADSNNLF